MDYLSSLALADDIARMAQGKEPIATREEIARWHGHPALAAAVAAGWMERVELLGQTDLGMTEEPGIRLTAVAQGLVAAALAVATGGEREEWTTLIRTGMGPLEVPPGSPLEVLLAGDWPRLASPSWDSREDLDAWLEARAAREAGPEVVHLPDLVLRLEAGAGAPWRCLGHHLTSLHGWCRLALAVVEHLPATHPQRRRLLRALRRCPLEPSLVCLVWEELWRQYRLRPMGRRLAREFATWSIWTAGERKRWQRRAEGRNHRVQDQTWPVRTLKAWLDHDAGGAVLADGLRVEARVLAAVRAEGWDGLHAEGWFWSVLARRLAGALFAAPVPGVWVAPLQREALDTGRWGWLHRRIGLMAQLTQAMMRDPI